MCMVRVETIGNIGIVQRLYGDLRVYTGGMQGLYVFYSGYAGIVGHILGSYRDNGKENGNYQKCFLL